MPLMNRLRVCCKAAAQGNVDILRKRLVEEGATPLSGKASLKITIAAAEAGEVESLQFMCERFMLYRATGVLQEESRILEAAARNYGNQAVANWLLQHGATAHLLFAYAVEYLNRPLLDCIEEHFGSKETYVAAVASEYDQATVALAHQVKHEITWQHESITPITEALWNIRPFEFQGYQDCMLATDGLVQYLTEELEVTWSPQQLGVMVVVAGSQGNLATVEYLVTELGAMLGRDLHYTRIEGDEMYWSFEARTWAVNMGYTTAASALLML